jgi:hypothetical protein
MLLLKKKDEEEEEDEDEDEALHIISFPVLPGCRGVGVGVAVAKQDRFPQRQTLPFAIGIAGFDH